VIDIADIPEKIEPPRREERKDHRIFLVSSIRYCCMRLFVFHKSTVRSTLLDQKTALGAMALVVVLSGWVTCLLADDEPWIITDVVVLTEPTELGHVIVLPGGSLTRRELSPHLHSTAAD